jgi:nucleoside-diphosphate-sugar epimerase
MKILVTGGAGFIGSKYVQEMEKQGHQCFVFDKPNHDILDTIDFRLALNDNDLCIHFAAMADVTVCIKEQLATFETNVRATFNLARICAEEKKPLIFISTCCVYGNSLDEIEKEDTTQPQAAEPYAVSKVAGEALIKGVPDLDYIILRIGTVYGVGQRDALFTGICLNNLRDDKTIFIDGDGTQTRQLVYIDDLVDGICKATNKHKDIIGETINLCGIEHTSALDTVDVAEVVTGKKANRVHREQRYGQTFKENISIKKAKELLDWIPTRTFLEGMKETYEKDERYHS